MDGLRQAIDELDGWTGNWRQLMEDKNEIIEPEEVKALREGGAAAWRRYLDACGNVPEEDIIKRTPATFKMQIF
jgi:hypothetical protein